jgi:RNA polymerase sigma-70 factor (ECF subfamily)
MNESQIIENLKNDSQQALREIYQLYAKRLFMFGLGYVKSRETAEELVEDTFIWLWTNRHSIRQTETLKSILFIRMHHFLINAYRSTVNAPEFSNYVDYLNSFSSEPTDSRLEYDEFVSQLKNAINELPKTQQKVVQMAKIEMVSIKDIAQKLNLTEQTVRNQLYLGLKELKRSLGLSYILIEFFIILNYSC